MIGPVDAVTDAGGALLARLEPMPAPMSALPAPGAAEVTASPQTAGFGTLLARAARGLADQTGEADRLQELAATGQLADPTAAIIATQQASLSLDLAVQVRNRLVEGWQELSRMPV